MSAKRQNVRHVLGYGAVALLSASALAVALLKFSPADAASQIILSGSIAQNCTINVTPDPAAQTLNLTGGAQHVTVGTVSQSCNKKAGYLLVVSSANCGAAPTGAKLIGAAGGETLVYSVESQNPTTGGSAAGVTGLLATACAAQNARIVSNAKINGENSTVFVNYTGNSGLGADTYQDTLTFTLNVK